MVHSTQQPPPQIDHQAARRTEGTMRVIGAEVNTARRRERNGSREGEEISFLAGDGGLLCSFRWWGRVAGDGQQLSSSHRTERKTQRRRELQSPRGRDLCCHQLVMVCRCRWPKKKAPWQVVAGWSLVTGSYGRNTPTGEENRRGRRREEVVLWWPEVLVVRPKMTVVKDGDDVAE